MTTIDPRDHLGLAYMAAHKLAKVLSVETEELVGDAYMVVEEAARLFDPAMGYRFSTYAMMRLRFKLYARTMIDAGKVRNGSTGRYRRPLDFQCSESLEHVRDREDHVEDRGPSVAREVEEVAVIARGISPKHEQVIRELAKTGCQKQAAEALGLTRQRVNQIVERVRRRVRGDDATAQVVPMIERGSSVREVAKALGISRNLVGQAWRQAKGPGTMPNQLKRTVAQLNRDEESYRAEVAGEYVPGGVAARERRVA